MKFLLTAAVVCLGLLCTTNTSNACWPCGGGGGGGCGVSWGGCGQGGYVQGGGYAQGGYTRTYSQGGCSGGVCIQGGCANGVCTPRSIQTAPYVSGPRSGISSPPSAHGLPVGIPVESEKSAQDTPVFTRVDGREVQVGVLRNGKLVEVRPTPMAERAAPKSLPERDSDKKPTTKKPGDSDD